MKRVRLLPIALAGLMTACNPPAKPDANTPSAPPSPGANLEVARHAGHNLASLVTDLHIARDQNDSRSRQTASALWPEIHRLKREGQHVREIEWYAAQLENNLRRGQPDDTARRHLLNNLDYEVNALNRRLR